MQTQHAQTLRTVWIVLAAIQGVLLILPLVLGSAVSNRQTLDPILPALLGVAAIGEGIAVAVLFRKRVLQPLKSRSFDLATDRGFGQLLQALVQVWALAESVALYGLLLRLLDYPPAWGLALAAGSAALLWLTRPSHPGLRDEKR